MMDILLDKKSSPLGVVTDYAVKKRIPETGRVTLAYSFLGSARYHTRQCYIG